MKERILLAFSGGLDTSAIIPWLKDIYAAEVIAYCADLGNSPEEKSLRAWAKELGAADLIFEDLQEKFVSDYVYPAVRAGALYQDDYLLGTALGRPLIAERMAHFARELQATAVAHGATGKGNDQLRFEKSWSYLIPACRIIAPWKEWNFTGRKDLMLYLQAQGHPVNFAEKVFSVDVNLFHRSCEGGILEDPELEFSCKDVYEWVRTPQMRNGDPQTVAISFEQGLPATLNGKRLAAKDLLATLNTLAGDLGIGVADIVEERTNGLKSRGVYETPGGTILHLAIKSLKHLVWDRTLLTTARQLGQTYAELAYDGLWHSDLRLALDSFFHEASKVVSGEITIKLEPGQARVLSRKSPFALYDKSSVSFEEDLQNMHKYALGYSKTVSYVPWRAGQRAQKLQRKGALQRGAASPEL